MLPVLESSCRQSSSLHRKIHQGSSSCQTSLPFPCYWCCSVCQRPFCITYQPTLRHAKKYAKVTSKSMCKVHDNGTTRARNIEGSYKISRKDINIGLQWNYCGMVGGVIRLMLGNPEILLVESRIETKIACGIRNPGLWNPESTNDCNPATQRARILLTDNIQSGGSCWVNHY